MPDGTFGSVSLEDYKGKFLVLFTYPLDFTFVCPTGESGTPARVCSRSWKPPRCVYSVYAWCLKSLTCAWCLMVMTVCP